MAELTPIDYRHIAELHCECLADSSLSSLGLRCVAIFYRFVNRSALERVFVYRQDGRVVGVGVLSLESRTLLRRVVLGSLFLLFAIPGLCRRALRGAFTRRTSPASTDDDAVPKWLPEFLLLFTSPALRGKGVGRALLAQCEEYLSTLGRRRYFLRTVDDVGNAALTFYAKCGFEAVGSCSEHGRTFRVLVKDIRGGVLASPEESASLPADAAQRVYSMLFSGAVPEVLKNRFEAAWRSLANSYEASEWDAYLRAMERIKDLEALEYACRRARRLRILTDQLVLMSFLAETLPERFDDFVARKSWRVLGFISLALGVIRSAAKLVKGVCLRRRIHV